MLMIDVIEYLCLRVVLATTKVVYWEGNSIVPYLVEGYYSNFEDLPNLSPV
jgi:hypothetical protein